ncbi:hypothetical protein GYMLUDRAFT_39698 [Collybiopsis luxurians FD-317 M1]|nr:hypothetical protein GYMLUDRAFT_39698 [Collybiopsis luxurians FD-317 M1]
MLWQYAVENYANSAYFVTVAWTTTSVFGLTVFSALPIQVFLSHRVKKLSGSRIIFITLLTLSCVEGSLGIMTSALSMQQTNILLMSHFHHILDSWTVISVVTDVAISACLIYYLRKSRTGSPSTNHVVSRLIRHAVESASVANFFSLMILMTTAVWPESTLGMIFLIPMGRVYTNTFLAILNSRPILRRELHGYSSSDNTITNLQEN